MGLKAEGAAEGFTLLGAIVILVYAIQQLTGAINAATGGSLDAVNDVVLAILLILIAILAVDACGFVYWKIARSGVALAIFGFIAIMVVLRNVSFDFIGWLMNVGTLAGLMILIAGVLLITRK
ncbi:MAG: hypothetical protein ACXADC_02260 [Candidatus Thorarchaeota archaeon]|jgi:hypothetical protein